MTGSSALLAPDVRAAIERVATAHLGRPFAVERVTDLSDRSSHPAALLHSPTITVFAKLLAGPHGRRQATAELSGLALISERSGVTVPRPVGSGRVDVGGSSVLLFEALGERVPEERTLTDWAHIGRALAQVHLVTGPGFGLGEDGFFGPLTQDNRPTPAGSWIGFYRDRRILPRLRGALDAGAVPAVLARQVERLVARLDQLAGPEPLPTLLHGDAQHHNFVSTDDRAVVIDVAPYFGHPELDLALVDYFSPVPAELFDAYAEIRPVDPGFDERRELWRIFAYLAVLTVDGGSAWGRTFSGRLQAAVDRYL